MPHTAMWLAHGTVSRCAFPDAADGTGAFFFGVMEPLCAFLTKPAVRVTDGLGTGWLVDDDEKGGEYGRVVVLTRRAEKETHEGGCLLPLSLSRNGFPIVILYAD